MSLRSTQEKRTQPPAVKPTYKHVPTEVEVKLFSGKYENVVFDKDVTTGLVKF